MPVVTRMGARIHYDVHGPVGGEPLLLIQGVGVQAIGWRPGFLDALVERGFRVIAFDNRDIGLSSRHPASALALVDHVVRGRLGLGAPASYTLADLAADAFAILDDLAITSAHLAGISMGGMIAQAMTVDRPDRVRSLASIMSSATPQSIAWWRLQPRLLRLVTENDPQRLVDAQLELLRAIGSKRYFDEHEARAYLEQTAVRAPDRSGVPRQLAAILASRDRRSGLRRLRVPTTVIHGLEDPLIPPAAGVATARLIGHARWVPIDHLGHDLPQPLWSKIIDAIDEGADRAVTSPALQRAS